MSDCYLAVYRANDTASSEEYYYLLAVCQELPEDLGCGPQTAVCQKKATESSFAKSAGHDDDRHFRFVSKYIK